MRGLQYGATLYYEGRASMPRWLLPHPDDIGVVMLLDDEGDEQWEELTLYRLEGLVKRKVYTLKPTRP